MHFWPERARFGFEDVSLHPNDYVNFLEEQGWGGFYRGHGLGGNEVYPAVSAVPEHLTHTHWIVDEGIRFLQRRDPDCPFMLWLVFEAPHSPFDPPEPFDRMYDDFEIPEAVSGRLGRSRGRAASLLIADRIARKSDRISPQVLQASAPSLLRTNHPYRLPVGATVWRAESQRSLRQHHHRHHLRSRRAPGGPRSLRKIYVFGIVGARADHPALAERAQQHNPPRSPGGSVSTRPRIHQGGRL